MKKKHLKSLNTIEKWLRKETNDRSGLKEAFLTISECLNDLPDEDEVLSEKSGLPLPKEIFDDPSMLAL